MKKQKKKLDFTLFLQKTRNNIIFVFKKAIPNPYFYFIEETFNIARYFYYKGKQQNN